MLLQFFAQRDPWFVSSSGVRGGPPTCLGVSGCQVPGYHPQIMGDPAQASPAFHPGWAVIAAAVQRVAPFQAAAPPFKAGAPVASSATPLLAFVREPLGRLLAGLGQDDLCDLLGPGILRVGSGIQPTVPRQQRRRMPKVLAVLGQTQGHLGFFVGIAAQDGVAPDDAALDLAQPAHAAALRGFPRFPLAHNRGVGLKETDNFLAGRHLCALHDPAYGLRDHLHDPR